MNAETQPAATPGRPVAGRRGVRFGLIVALLFWLGLVCGGTMLMARYSNTPGPTTAAPALWPQHSDLPVDANRPTLLMFVHPHCPCSRASLGELDQLLAEISHLPKVVVVFVKPTGTAADWAETDLWRSASSIRGVSTYLDKDGVEAQRFGAETSGETFLYDRYGKLSFQGGITPSRGHAGDSPGRTSLRELLQKGHADQLQMPVYGCALFDEQCPKGKGPCKR